jgi:CheY-like chemotaxis protein
MRGSVEPISGHGRASPRLRQTLNLGLQPSCKDAMKTVVLIDNDEEFRESLRSVLEHHGLEVLDSSCPQSAFQELQAIDKPDLILCELHMPFAVGDDAGDYKVSYEVGLKTLQELAWVYPGTPVVALTELNQLDLARIKKYLDPIPAYHKPESALEVIPLVEGYLHSREWGGVQ